MSLLTLEVSQVILTTPLAATTHRHLFIGEVTSAIGMSIVAHIFARLIKETYDDEDNEL